MNKKHLLFLFGLVVFTTQTIKAQQDPQLTQFMYDRLSINPGSAGTGGGYCATGIFRQQWYGFGKEPRTVLLNFQAPVDMLKGGVGLTYYFDQLGWETNNVIRLSYSYHYGIGPGTLGGGLSLGYFSKVFNASWITPDGQPASTDNSIPDAQSKQGGFDAGLGLYYWTDNYYAGISTTHLTQSELKNLNVKTARHYYLMGGYKYDINSDFSVQPNLLLKSDFTSTQLDVNLTVMFRDMIWLGASYRLQDVIVAPMVGYKHNFDKYGTLKVGYSYDMTASKIKNYSSGTHEIFLNYCFNIDITPPIQRVKHPRFL